jgi:PDZ domain-containing protein
VLFLAPQGNCDEVVTGAPDGLQVVPVETLAQARDVLEGAIEPPVCPA